MTNLFAYGSLMFKEVINPLTTTKDYESCKGTLVGYTRKYVKNNVYPGIYQSQGERVEGVVYYSVTNTDMELLNKFEDV
jgi:gamma-glutamylcyclotransferase (GGCT)/AIG2-like uncharacterized protein YtfP